MAKNTSHSGLSPRKVTKETLIYLFLGIWALINLFPLYWMFTFSLKSNKDRYSCLVYSFVAKDEGKDKEVVRFFITDDANHLPVRLDMFLRFGSAKAFMMSYSGLRNPVTSKRSK